MLRRPSGKPVGLNFFKQKKISLFEFPIVFQKWQGMGNPWWRYQMERFLSVTGRLIVGNSPVTGEFLSQRPVTWSFDVFFLFAWTNGWVNNRDAGDLRRRLYCLLNYLFRRRSYKTSKLHFTGLCEGNSPVTGEFPTQRASNAENVSIWWRHHADWVLRQHSQQWLPGNIPHCLGTVCYWFMAKTLTILTARAEPFIYTFACDFSGKIISRTCPVIEARIKMRQARVIWKKKESS